MRASRLIALLLELQARPHVTAAELAERLEVSVRTIYRDTGALQAAGVPLWTEAGPGRAARRPAGARAEGRAVVPGRRPPQAAAHVPGEPDRTGERAGRAGRASARLRPRAVVAGVGRRVRPVDPAHGGAAAGVGAGP